MMTIRSTTFVLVIALIALAMTAVVQAQEPAEEPAPAPAPAPAPEPTGGYVADRTDGRPQPAQVITLPTTPPQGEAAFPGDEIMAADIGNLLRNYLMTVRGMSVATIHPASPMIRNNPNLMPEQVEVVEGEGLRERAMRMQPVVEELGVDYALVPAIVQYKFDATKPAATVTLNVLRVEAEGELATIIVSGRSPDRPPRRADEQMLARTAVDDAALRAAAQILGVSADDLRKWAKVKRSGQRHRRFFIF